MQAVAQTKQFIKNSFVNELRALSSVDSLFVLAYKDSRISSSAGRYLVVELKDRTGIVRGIQFDRANFAEVPPLGSVVHVIGKVEGEGVKKRIKISNLEAAYDYDPRDFIAQSKRPISEMREEFSRVLASLERKSYLQLAKKIFGNKDLLERFFNAPASDTGIGAWRGGALEQSLKLARLIDSFCQIYPHANRDELMVAALTYLVGAIEAFEFDTSITRTKAGAKLEPVFLSSLRLQKVSALANAKGSEAVMSMHELYMLADKGLDVQEVQRIEKVIFHQALQALAACELADKGEARTKQAGY